MSSAFCWRRRSMTAPAACMASVASSIGRNVLSMSGPASLLPGAAPEPAAGLPLGVELLQESLGLILAAAALGALAEHGKRLLPLPGVDRERRGPLPAFLRGARRPLLVEPGALVERPAP